jgi:formylglycine-generating enzyme required for sulfatase activity
MFCERCNVEYSEGLRYCKWCGQTLSLGPRVTSELRKCHSCGASVQPGWTFCKACGIRLAGAAANPNASAGAPEQNRPSSRQCPRCHKTIDALAVHCPACGEAIGDGPRPAEVAPAPQGSRVFCFSCGAATEPGVAFCKHCGAAVSRSGPVGAGTAALVCTACGGSNPTDAIECQACGSRVGVGGGRGAQTNVMDVSTARRAADTIPDLTAQIPPGTSQDLAPASTDQAGRQPPYDSAQLGEGNARQSPISSDDVPTSYIGQGQSGSGLREPATQERTAVLDSGQSFKTRVTETPGIGGPPFLSASEQERNDRFEAGSANEAPTAEHSVGTDTASRETRTIAPAVAAAETHESQSPVRHELAKGVPVAGPTAAGAKKSRAAAIIAVVAGLAVVVAAGGLLAWYYLPPGAKTERRTSRTANARNASDPGSSATPQASPSISPSPTPGSPAGPLEDMVLVQGGTYTIGRDDGDRYARPGHAVSLQPFYVDKTEVTNAQYKKFVDATGRKPPLDWADAGYPTAKANWPVTQITWQDAAAYAKWAGKRLPTESEWEAAARGSDGRTYPWGNDWKPGIANIETSGISEVGQYKESISPCGALDMIGNVWEWTADEFAMYPGSTAPRPELESGREYRVIRGGAYDGNRKNDATYRGYIDANKPYPKIGFRCVKSAGG